MAKPGLQRESGNYRLYRSTAQSRTYLVVSTFFGYDGEKLASGFEETDTKALGADLWRARYVLPSKHQTWETSCIQITLRTHGYNTRFGDFLRQVVDESDPDPNCTLRPANRFYIGYRWPSAGIGSWRSIADTLSALAITWSISVLLLLIPILALSRLGHLPQLMPVLGPFVLPLFSAVTLGVGIGLLLLRGSTYLSDRYRALHYGVPDLAEFVRDLDDQINPMRIRADIDMVGHSMGCLLLVNAVRIMTDFFHYPGDEGQTLSRAAMIRLRSLVLCAADIPMVLAVPGRNNYFLSSLRRFSAIHVLSSDRDIILKWASNIGNWASEPRFDMSSRRLGNALLVKTKSAPSRLQGEYIGGEYLPVTRPGRQYIPASETAWEIEEGCKTALLQFHDCSRCWSVGGDLKWAAGAGIVAALVGGALWFSPFGVLAKWPAVLVWILYVLGFGSRWLQHVLADHWRLGPAVGLLGDWPSTTAFGSRFRNPHGGYFMRGDEPRHLIARLIANSGDADSRELSQKASRIRSSALRIPLGPITPTSSDGLPTSGREETVTGQGT
jgi:hypothetical protein